MDKQKHLVMVTHGVEDGLRQILFAFQFSITLRNMGVDVTMFLTGLAAKWAFRSVESTVQGDDFHVLKDYIKEFTANGGKILVCRTCYGEEYNLKGREEMDRTVADGVQLVGLNVIAEKSLESKVIAF